MYFNYNFENSVMRLIFGKMANFQKIIIYFRVANYFFILIENIKSHDRIDRTIIKIAQ